MRSLFVRLSVPVYLALALLFSAASPGYAQNQDYYCKISVNDAPDGGRFTLEAFMLEAVNEGTTGGRPLLLRFARSSGEASYIITWDLALQIRSGARFQRGLRPLGEEPLDGFLPEGEERWAVWWVSRDWGWASPRDLQVVYGDDAGRLSLLDARGTRQALNMIPEWVRVRVDSTVAEAAASAAAAVGSESGSGSGSVEGGLAGWTPDLNAFDVLPVPVHAPAPLYPRSAEGFSFRGAVNVAVHVRADGSVADVRVLQSTAHHVLNVAALKGVEQWTFKPGLKNGRPVEGDLMVPVRFGKIR